MARFNKIIIKNIINEIRQPLRQRYKSNGKLNPIFRGRSTKKSTTRARITEFNELANKTIIRRKRRNAKFFKRIPPKNKINRQKIRYK